MQKKENGLLKITGISGAVISWLYVVAIAGILPFYVTDGYAHIGSDKAQFFATCGHPIIWGSVVLLVLYEIIRMITSCKGKKIKEIFLWIKNQFSKEDIWLIAYLLTLIISYFSAVYKDVAWSGNDRWPLGLETNLMVILSYFAVSRLFTGSKYFFELVTKVSGIVFLIAVLDRYNLRLFEMKFAATSVVSTIGNINWFCGYWSVVAWITFVSYWNRGLVIKKRMDKWDAFWDIVLATFAMYTGIVQGSDSGLLAIAVVFCVILCMSLDNGCRMQRFVELLFMLFALCSLLTIVNIVFYKESLYPSVMVNLMTRTVFPWIMMVLCGVLHYFIKEKNQIHKYPANKLKIFKKIIPITCAVVLGAYVLILTLNTLMPEGLGILADKSLFVFDNSWGSNRGCTWKAAVMTWWNQDLWHKIVGVGPDGMWSFIYNKACPELTEMVYDVFGDSRLLNGHNEWLTNLANVGVLGAITYAGFIISYIVRFFRKGKDEPVLYVFAISVLAYTVNNIFSFRTIINYPHLFLLMGVGESLLRQKEYEKK